MVPAISSRHRRAPGKAANQGVPQRVGLRIAAGIAVCLSAFLGFADGLRAQTELFQFQPPLLICVLPPAPSPPPAPWPVAATDAFAASAGAPFVFARAALLANDVGAFLTVVSIGPTSSAGGTIAGIDPLTYTPPPVFAGEDIFAYEISDPFGQTTTGLVKVRVTVDASAPTVAITAPPGGSSVSGTVTVTASASDNVAVAGVKFFDGLDLIGAEDLVPPYAATWNTTVVADGMHYLTAVARDTSGNRMTSEVVQVTVSSEGGPTAPPAGLVLALGFDEVSGTTAFDASGGNRNGVIAGALRATGMTGGALRFDGVDDWVTVNDSAALDLTTGMTLSAWVSPSAFTGWETVMLKERGVGALAYALYAQDGGSLPGGANAPAGTIRAGSDDHAVRGAAPLPLNVWTHLATTYDGARQRIYVNGVLVASRAQAGAIALSGGPLRIGGNTSWDGEFFAGLIDEVRIYNRALSAPEVATDMGVGPSAPPPADTTPVPGGSGPVAAYSFNEGSGATAIDRSGDGLNGTIRGAQFAVGKHGMALQFDGVDDWVTIGDVTGSALDLTTGTTLSAWVNPFAFTGWETVILKERGAGAMSYALYAQDGGALNGGADTPSGVVHASGADRTLRASTRIPLHTWTHLATTYDGMTQRIYVNGVLVASRAQTGPIAVGNGALRIGGNNSWAGEFFSGLIDEVRVYNRALTDSEITTDMHTPLP